MKEFLKKLTPGQKKAIIVFVGAGLGVAASFYPPVAPVVDLALTALGLK